MIFTGKRGDSQRQCVLFPISIETHFDARITDKGRTDEHVQSANGNLWSNADGERRVNGWGV